MGGGAPEYHRDEQRCERQLGGPAYISRHTSCARVRDSLPQQGQLPLYEQSTHGLRADHVPQPRCRMRGNASGRCTLSTASEVPAGLCPSLHAYQSLASVWPRLWPRRSEVPEAPARRVGATAYASPEGRVDARRERTRCRRPTTPLTHTASGVPLRGGSLQPSSASTAPSRRGSSETMTVRLPGGLPRHSVSPYLACASLQERCDLSHTLWSPERGTFPRISDACQEGGYRRRTFQHGLIRCSP